MMVMMMKMMAMMMMMMILISISPRVAGSPVCLISYQVTVSLHTFKEIYISSNLVCNLLHKPVKSK